MGSGTTAVAAKKLGRNYIGFELSQEYCDLAESRLSGSVMKKKEQHTQLTLF
jgi:DNA modification methylase